MTKTKLFTTSLLGLTLAFASCQRDDFNDGPAPGQSATEQIEGIDLDSLRLAGPDPRLPNVVPITLHASTELTEDFRGLEFKMTNNRPGTDYKGDPYTDEYRPTLLFSDDAWERADGTRYRANPTVDVYLTLVKVNAANQVISGSVHNQIVTFTLTGDAPEGGGEVERTNGRYTMSYRGHITLPDDHSTLGTSADKWYVMGMFNPSSYRLRPSSISGGQPFVGAYAFVNMYPDRGRERSDSIAQVLKVPFASNWTELYVERAPGASESTGYNYRLTDNGTELGSRMNFKPLGILLQVDEGQNVYRENYNKFDVIVSNALDFSVRFDFSESAVTSAFNNRNVATGEGVPDIVQGASVDTYFSAMFEEFKRNSHLYNINDASYPLSSSDKAFPWDMPALHHNSYSQTEGSYSTLRTLSQGSDAESASGIIHFTAGRSRLNGSTYWHGTQRGKRRRGRSIRLVWALPKKVAPAQPYTYFYSAVYPVTNSTDNVFTKYGSFDFINRVLFHQDILQRYLVDLSGYDQNIYNYERTMQALADNQNSGTYRYAQAQKERYENLSAPIRSSYRAQREGTNYLPDSTLFYGTYYPEYLQFANVYSQPSIPIYQTNETFHRDGKPLRNKVIHIQTLRTTDLLITEVLHKEVDGHNYSAVEIHNPTYTLMDMANYALVRLSSDGSRYRFRKNDGTLTDNVTEAQILPLAALHPNTSANPFSVPGFSTSFPTSNSGTFAANRRRPVVADDSGSTVDGPDNGDYKGQTQILNRLLDNNNRMTLMPNQVMLVGGSGYVNNPVSTSTSWWSDWNSALDQARRTFSFRSFIAYADGRDQTTNGSSTLDMQAGDGFALIKKTDDSGQWQIVDATVPIGAMGYAFAGTFADYRAQVNGFTAATDYSQKRFPYVQYPFIFPYRTKRFDPTRWSDDWDMISSSIYTDLGRNGTEDHGGFYGPAAFFLKRTPWSPDPNWITRYKAGRPVQR